MGDWAFEPAYHCDPELQGISNQINALSFDSEEEGDPNLGLYASKAKLFEIPVNLMK